MRRKNIRRGAVFAVVLGVGLTGMVTASTLNAPFAVADTANTTGPYDPTPSGGDNQGNGNAPENGTVGKADAKNPNGQLPGGSDSNNGYECDGNNGIGDEGGNPAHTGCVETEQEPGGPGGPGGPGSSSVDTPEEEGEVLGESEEAPTPGSPDVPRGETLGETVVAAPAAAAVAAAPAQLPVTGPGMLTYVLALVGTILVLGGLVLVRATKESAVVL